jgi:two-component system sensor histidine kinase YesM
MHSNLLKTSFFHDLSLKGKLALTLILCIILPIFIIATNIGQNLSKEYRRNAYENQLHLMDKSIDDIDLLYDRVLDLKNTFQTNYDIQKIVKGSATAKDYYNAVTKINDLILSNDYIHSVTLSTEEKIIFQQDKFLLYVQPEFFQKALDSGDSGFWTATYPLENAFFEKDKKLQVQSYFCLINQIQNRDNILTVLGITLKEDMLAKLLPNQFEGAGAKNLMIREDGLVISSTDKGLINTKLEDFISSLEGKSGFLEGKDDAVTFYTQSSQEGLYLVSIIPQKVFYAGQISLSFTIWLAILLSSLFGIVFSIIQNRYIINPLNELLVEMEKVESGDFSPTEKVSHKDEIGHIAVHFEEMKLKLKQTIDEVYLSRIHEQDARYTALLAQLNPHFLYNTLDSIRWLAIKNKDFVVGEQIETLADIFRHVLNEGREFVKIEDELSFVTDYMFLMKARHGDRIRLEILADDDVKSLLIPKLIIQPLVENSIQHGLESKLEGGNIKIVIRIQDDQLNILVEDNGIGCDEDKIRAKLESGNDLSSAFALQNIHRRLRLCYGENYGLHINTRIHEGFGVYMTIPLGEHNCNEIDDN